MSVVSGRLQREAAERIIRLIEKTNLPVEAPLAHAHDDIMQLMRLDKKVAAGRIRFVLADAIGQAKLYDDIEPAWIEAGLNRVLQ
jgi:3-dehydroquinate synthase